MDENLKYKICEVSTVFSLDNGTKDLLGGGGEKLSCLISRIKIFFKGYHCFHCFTLLEKKLQEENWAIYMLAHHEIQRHFIG